MTKNRFLSKRLACLLTTALVSMPITLNKSFAQLAVTADATVVVGNTTITFDGNAADTLTIVPVAAGLAFTGAVTLAANSGNGNIQVNGIANAAPGVATFNAAVGTTTLRLGTITIGTALLGGAATFDAAVFAAGAVSVVAGNVTAETGTATFSSTFASADSVTVGASATGNFTGVVTTPSLVVNGTANITAKDQATNVVTLGDAGVIQLAKTMTATAAADSVFSNTDQEAGTLSATGKVLLPSRLKGGDTINLFDDSTTTTTAAALVTRTDLIVQDNALADHTAGIYSATGKLAATGIVVTATNKTAAVTASELGVNVNKATAFLQARDAAIAADIATTDTASLSSIYNVLYALSGESATADTNFANQVSPQTDTITGSTVAAKAVTSGVQNVISTRLASLRSGDAYSTGVVTGSGMSANSGFIQAFGSTVEQKNKGNEFGYDADTTGFAIGFDGKIDGGAVIGISYARSEADVDGKGTGRAKNDIKTDSVSLYADYATKDGYVEGSITYGKSDNKGSRVINTGGLSNTYTSNSDSEQYSFRLSGGIPQSLGGGAFFTPFAAATISQIKADAYTEKSTTANDALRLRVAQDTVDSQVGTVGVKFHQAIKDGKTTFTPEVKLAVNQEFGDDTITTTNTYQGGVTSFKNSTAIEKTSATAGVGLNISSDNVSFNIGYEADVRDKYLGHSAQAKITAKF